MNPKSETAGVYKMVIDDRWVYIGSSRNLYKRLGQWRGKLKEGSYRSRNIRKVLNTNSVVKFTIIKTVTAHEDLLSEETYFIGHFFGKPNCLNMCPQAGSSIGRKMPLGYEYKKRTKNGVKVQPRPVARFDMNWNYIDSSHSITKMAELLGCPRPSDFTSKVADVIRGKVRHYKGYKFKFINPDGSFQDINLFIGVRRSKKVLHEHTNNGGKTKVPFRKG